MTIPSNEQPSRKRRQWFPLALIAVLGIAAGIGVALLTKPVDPGSDDGDDQQLAGIQASLVNTQVLPDDFKTIPAFKLIDGNNQPATEALLEGKWSLMFFGYTHCPDVCPVTLSVMQEVVETLKREGDEPMQVIFVSVDPKRDTPDIMGNYVRFFNEDFIGLSGELSEINALTKALGIVAVFTANKEHPENYIVDHTASMLFVDPQKRVRGKFNAPHRTEDIVKDYRTLKGALSDSPT